MVQRAIVAIISFCTRHAYGTITVAMLIAAAAAYYSEQHFSINTDINTLISEKLPWRQRELKFEKSIPQRYDNILLVVDAPTPELAALARSALANKLADNKELFPSVTQLGGTPFFAQNGILFRSKEEVSGVTTQLAAAAPLIRVPVVDPSLRGLSQMIALVLAGVREHELTLDDVAGPFAAAAVTLENVLAGRPATFSWHELMNGAPSTPSDLRRLIDVRPKLDFTALEPGKEAADAIRAAAASLDLASRFQARVRLTGPVPIADEEFATVKDGAFANGVVTFGLVLFILWLALRSLRIILAVVIALLIGLSITAMVGLMLVGALNLISIAFAVLFIGLGVDFGIQFSVRYRQERFKMPDLRKALLHAGVRAGIPLTLAAAAVAAGFLSFLPTAYRGVSELGVIAGAGMMVAYITSITVLPALLYVLHPAGEPEGLGFAWLAPVDDFLEKRRRPIIVVTLGLAIAGLPLLFNLHFDFNPMNLRSPKVESIATYLDLRRDPTVAANSINVLVPSTAAANQTAERLKALPEVDSVVTMADFVPTDQPQKLGKIAEAAAALNPVLRAPPRPTPSDADNIEALKRTIDGLTKAAAEQAGRGADASLRLASALSELAAADQAVRKRAEDVFIVPIKSNLDDFRNLVQAKPVSIDNLPPEVIDNWRGRDGNIRVEAMPKGNPDDNENIRAFARAVLAVEPNAIGGPISILESGNTVVRAFIEAGAWALGSITMLLWLTLRRFGDVLLTLVPLILAGIVTLELCVLIGLPLNFANIVALPLLLGVGVAFKIYYILAWRAGRTKFLQSSLTRAVIFSAATTATAFGSLWLSSHPGTSSMGKLLALSLCCTLAAAVLFQPALMGRPRAIRNA
ncbi:MAG TPA: MMPL family transporter [Xanthobacteraceae bacterium]|nr:MMPL family transporter [Xanthobacteraceae bacterium]